MSAAEAGVDLSVVVPCYNEEGNVGPLVERAERALRAAGVKRFELLLVDDASRDGTWEAIAAAARRCPVVVPVRHPENRGIVGGWRSGLARSRGRIVLTTDADLQYAPEDIPLLFAEFASGPWDLVQGWRRQSKELSRLRKLLSAGFSFLLRLLFGMRLHDVKSGFIAYRREVLADILDYRFRYFAFQSLPTVAAHFKGYRIRQIPITFHPRHSGESFIRRPFVFSLRSAMDLPKALVEYRFLRPRRRPAEGRRDGQGAGGGDTRCAAGER